MYLCKNGIVCYVVESLNGLSVLCFVWMSLGVLLVRLIIVDGLCGYVLLLIMRLICFLSCVWIFLGLFSGLLFGGRISVVLSSGWLSDFSSVSVIV